VQDLHEQKAVLSTEAINIKSHRAWDGIKMAGHGIKMQEGTYEYNTTPGNVYHFSAFASKNKPTATTRPILNF
jgi:hypothetical protein